MIFLNFSVQKQYHIDMATASSESSCISTVEIENIIDQLKTKHYRTSTKTSYRSVWKSFNKFFKTIKTIKHKQSSTIRSYILAICAILSDIGIELDLDQCLITSLTRVCRVVNDMVRTRLPIKKSTLTNILTGVQQQFAEQLYLNRLYSAIFSTIYFGLFRVGEITKSPHVVLDEDVLVALNQEKIQFTLLSSKTHGKNTLPQKIKISSTSSSTAGVDDKGRNIFCLYKLLRKYIEVRPKICDDVEQFFVFSDRSPVTPNQFRICLKTILKRVNLNHREFSSHSFRIRHCCNLLQIWCFR